MKKETKKQISFGIVLSYAVIIVQFATGILYTPIVSKCLGQSQYGVYSLCTSFIGYLTIMNGGANAAYIRFYVQYKEKDSKRIPGLNGIFLKIFSVLALIALIGGWILGEFSPFIFGNKISSAEYELVKICFRLLAFNSGIQVINCVFSSLIIANEQFIFSKVVNLIIAVLNPVLTVPFLLSGYSCISIIVVHLVTTGIALASNAIYCIKKLNVNFRLKESDTALLKNIIQFSGFIVLQSIMDQINWEIDKFILARTHGTSEISVYSVGSTFNRYYMTFASVLSNVFIAQVNRLQARNDKEGINSLFIQSSRVFAYFVWLFMSAYIIFGRQFVSRWAGDAYGNSYIIGLLLMLPVTASCTMGLAQDIARAMNKHQLQILINLAICIINGIVSIPLAIRWGALGSAAGTFVAEICMCLVAEPIYFSKVLGLNMKELVKQIGRVLPGMIIPVILGIALNCFGLLKADYYNIAAYGILYVAVYCGSMWVFALNSSEKDMLRKALNNVLRRKR